MRHPETQKKGSPKNDKPMSRRHASFTITRQLEAAPARVFEAFAKEEAKAKWFAGPPGWEQHEKSFDFREGGRETLKGRHASGMVIAFDCIYRDIVEPGASERAHHLQLCDASGRQEDFRLPGDHRDHAGRQGTKLVVTEYGDFLDGYDDAGSREQGTNFLIDQLEKSLA